MKTEIPTHPLKEKSGPAYTFETVLPEIIIAEALRVACLNDHSLPYTHQRPDRAAHEQIRINLVRIKGNVDLLSKKMNNCTLKCAVS